MPSWRLCLSPPPAPAAGVVRHKEREIVVADIPGLDRRRGGRAPARRPLPGDISSAAGAAPLIDANTRRGGELSRGPRRAGGLWRRTGRKAGGGGAQQDRHARRRADRRASAELEEASGGLAIPDFGASGVGVDWRLTSCSRRRHRSRPGERRRRRRRSNRMVANLRTSQNLIKGPDFFSSSPRRSRPSADCAYAALRLRGAPAMASISLRHLTSPGRDDGVC